MVESVKNGFLFFSFALFFAGCSSGSTEQETQIGESYVPEVTIGITLSSDEKLLIEDFCRLEPGMDRSDVEWFMSTHPRWSDEHGETWQTSVALLRVTYGADHETVEWLEADFIEKGFDFPCRWLRG
jgi:hypothetical protein